MIVVGAIQFFILLVALIRGKALALLLGPEGVGIIGTIDQFVMTITQLSALGLPFAAMKFMSSAHATGERAFRDTFAGFARLMLGLAALVVVLSLAYVLFAPAGEGELAGYRAALLIALFGVPGAMFTVLIAQTFAAAQKPRAAAAYNLAYAACVAGAALTGVVLGGLQGFYLGTAVAGALVVIGAMVWLGRTMGLGLGRSSEPVLREKSLIVRTAMASYTTLVSVSILLLIVRYVVLKSDGEAEVGLLQSALSVGLSVGSILGTIAALHLAPKLNRKDPLVEKFQSTGRFAGEVAFFVALGALPVALLPGLVLSILYTGEFAGAAVALILCLIWQALSQVMTAYSHLLIGIDRPMSATFATLLSVAAGIGAVALLVGGIGMLAAPVALILTTLVRAAAMIAVLVLRVGMPMPWGVIGRFALVTAGLAGAALLFDTNVVIPDLPGAILRVLYALVVIGLVWGTKPRRTA